MLADLANAPTDQNSLSVFTFAHSDLCLRTIDYLNGKGNNLVMQQLDPVALNDVQNFLLRVQTVHNGINGVLGVTGFDLLDLNIKDPSSIQSWAFNVFSEAQQWQTKTGLA
jgi:hypothetical protein